MAGCGEFDGSRSAAEASRPQHFLYFFPLPQGHGSFLPGFTWPLCPRKSALRADAPKNKAGIAARLGFYCSCTPDGLPPITVR